MTHSSASSADESNEKDIEFDVDMEIIEYTGNEGLMRHVWDNLISNAIKFSPEGGAVKIHLAKRENIEFVIEDNGPGIADVELAMREGFSTAPETIRNLGFGAGMGLPNMKRNTDSMTIESTVGVGTKIAMTVKL